jgi:hypothetical protein
MNPVSFNKIKLALRDTANTAGIAVDSDEPKVVPAGVTLNVS